jgi:phosphoribosylglycinamide formyltransferase-1
MQAILDAIASGGLEARIGLVLSDQPEAYILERARSNHLAHGLIDCEGYRNRFPKVSQEATVAQLQKAEVDLVCLAGFMRLVKAPLLEAFPDRILNIHPSLLPAYPGMAAWEQAGTDGAAESGCTVHLVDQGMDTGPILAQARVPVLPDDTAATLHQRIQREEHRLYPETIANYAQTLGPR